MKAIVKQFAALVLTVFISTISWAESGGMSGGGGNAEGGKFFDFYENEGSVTLKHDQIKEWNQNVATIIERANALVPQVGASSLVPQERTSLNLGLGSVLVKAIESRKWLLEPKPITEESCKNDSMVATINRKIVGCQNFYEVRISKTWLEDPETTAVNAAGLVVHEAILTWMRDLKLNRSKEDLEFSVREVNRMLFDVEMTSEQFVEAITKLVPEIVFYTFQEAAFEKSIPAKVLEIKANYCATESLADYSALLSSAKEFPKSNETIYNAFRVYFSIVKTQMRLQAKEKLAQNIAQDRSELNELKESFCKGKSSRRPDLSQVTLNTELLGQQCKQEVEKTFNHYLEFKDMGEGERTADALAESTALFCSGMKSIEIQHATFWPLITEKKSRALMDEVYLQALKFYYSLKDATN
jgi:hypothetical protein